MTTGSPTKILIRFLVPMFIGNIFQQLYSLADTMIVGRILGARALATVGASYPVIVFIMAIASGLSMGTLVTISSAMGTTDKNDVRKTIFTSLTLAVTVGTLFVIFGLLFSRTIINVLKTPIELHNKALQYLRIWISSSIFLFLYNAITAVFNALGRPKVPIIFISIASILNIGLDFLFILGLKIGLNGAAWASFIAFGAASIGLLIYVGISWKKLPIAAQPSLFDIKTLWKITKTGVPSALQQSIISVGLFILQIFINGYGSVVIAGYTAATKIDIISRFLYINLGTAISSFCAENIAANKIDRVKKGYRSALLLSLCISVLLAAIIIPFGGVLVGLFIDKAASPLEHQIARGYLTIVSSFYMILGYLFVTNGLYRASNRMGVLITSSCLNITFKIISAILLSKYFGYIGIWWANPVGWMAGALIDAITFAAGWRKKDISLPQKAKTHKPAVK